MVANKIGTLSLASAAKKETGVLIVKLFLLQAGGLCGTGYKDNPTKITRNIVMSLAMCLSPSETFLMLCGFSLLHR